MTPLALRTLVRIMKDPHASKLAKVRCAEIILERGFGKPAQQHTLSLEDGAPLSFAWLEAETEKHASEGAAASRAGAAGESGLEVSQPAASTILLLPPENAEVTHGD